MTVFTGIIFLNMSFFLAEISALRLDKSNKQLVENLVRSLSCVSEEERHAPGGENHDSAPSVNEVDFILIEWHRSLLDEFVVIQNKYQDNINHFHKSPSSETPIQPPEA